jgi:hypothetical protein
MSDASQRSAWIPIQDPFGPVGPSRARAGGGLPPFPGSSRKKGQNRRLEPQLCAGFVGPRRFVVGLSTAQAMEHGLSPFGRANLNPGRKPLDRQRWKCPPGGPHDPSRDRSRQDIPLAWRAAWCHACPDNRPKSSTEHHRRTTPARLTEAHLLGPICGLTPFPHAPASRSWRKPRPAWTYDTPLPDTGVKKNIVSWNPVGC